MKDNLKTKSFFCLTGFDSSINIKYVIANYSRKTTSVNFKELAITTVVVNFFLFGAMCFQKGVFKHEYSNFHESQGSSEIYQ